MHRDDDDTTPLNDYDRKYEKSVKTPTTAELFAPCGDCKDKNKFLIFWILYVVAGLLMFIFGCIDLAYCVRADKVNWLITTTKTSLEFYFTPNYFILYILFLLWILSALFVAVLICLRGSVVRNSQVYEMAFSQFGKFLGAPMLICVFMMVIPIAQQGRWQRGLHYNREEVACKAACFVLCIFALGGFAFIYYKLGGCSKNLWPFLYKKCFISASVSYCLFLLFNSLSDLIRDDAVRKHKDIHTRLEGVSIAFIIIFSLLLGAMSFYFTDLVMAGYGFFFNLAFMINSARTRHDRYFNFVQRIKGNLVCSIIFMLAFIGLAAFIVFFKREKIMD